MKRKRCVVLALAACLLLLAPAAGAQEGRGLAIDDTWELQVPAGLEVYDQEGGLLLSAQETGMPAYAPQKESDGYHGLFLIPEEGGYAIFLDFWGAEEWMEDYGTLSEEALQEELDWMLEFHADPESETGKLIDHAGIVRTAQGQPWLYWEGAWDLDEDGVYGNAGYETVFAQSMVTIWLDESGPAVQDAHRDMLAQVAEGLTYRPGAAAGKPRREPAAPEWEENGQPDDAPEHEPEEAAVLGALRAVMWALVGIAGAVVLAIVVASIVARSKRKKEDGE